MINYMSMKNCLYYLLTVLLLLSGTRLNAQWVHTKGPDYGGVVAMAYQSPWLFAATYTGLFRTSDNGQHWEQVKGLPENTVKGLVVADNKVFAACWYFGLYVSNDYGNTWEKTGTEMPVGSKAGTSPSIPYHKLFSTSGYLYCNFYQGNGNKLYRSSDNGKSWHLFLSNQYVEDLIQVGDTILINDVTTTIRSVNNGASFSGVTGLASGISTKFGKINNTWVAAVRNTSNPFRYSNNGGAAFSNGTVSGLPPFTINNVLTLGNKIFISTNTGIYQSTDGVSWTLMPAPPPLVSGATDGYGNLFENNGDLWCGSYQFYLSQDTGVTFSIRNYGLTSSFYFRKYCYNPSDNYLYTTETSKGTLLRSSDHGDTWNGIGSGLPTEGSNSRFILNNGAVYFAGTDSGLFKSTDNAVTWTKITTAPISNVLIKGNTEFYAGTQDGVYKSTDSCLTWSPANSGFTNYPITTLRWHQQKLYAGGAGGLLMSSDSGASWTLLNGSLSVINKAVVDFAITDDSIFTRFCNSKIFRSYDWGTTWNQLNSGVNPLVTLPGEICIVDTNYFFSNPTASYGVYMCSYNNTTWIPINEGLTLDTLYASPQPREITKDNDYLYLNGYNYGCYRLDLNNILIAGRLSGKVFWDKNGNGTRQSTEPYLADEILESDPGNYALDTDTNGTYRYYYFGNTPTYTIQLRPKPYWFITTSPSQKVVTPLGQNIDTLNFGVKMIAGVTDISAALNTVNHRPGSHPNYFLIVTNLGTDTISDIATVTLDNNLTYLSGSPYQSINGNVLTFAYNNLVPGQSATFLMNTSVNTNVMPGNVLYSSAIANPIAGDTVPSNNMAECRPLVAASYDPNNKNVEPAGNIGDQDKLTYQINFQNTGNDTAFIILIRDTLSSTLDANTFQYICASHPVTTSIKNGNILEFRFDQILLPDSTTDEPNSHGYVKFSILPAAGLPLNTVIQNNAAIYFDFNVPIITNSTTNTITGFTGIPVQSKGSGLNSFVDPNPLTTDAMLTIDCQEKGLYFLRIYTSDGKIISSAASPTNSMRISRNTLGSGMYIYEVRTPMGLTARGKFIVQ